MSLRRFLRSVAICCCALLVQCSGRSAGTFEPYASGAGVNRAPSIITYRIVHSFGKAADGANSQTPLVSADGALFGSTFHGGNLDEGAIFRLTIAGAERVIHSFGSAGDSGTSSGALIALGGKLYGASSSGTLFSMTYAGAEKVVYRFGSALNDGFLPDAGPIALNGKLYGVTLLGGKHDDGIVYSVTLSGSERILHNFAGKDGRSPGGRLTYYGNKFYGITLYGGAFDKGTLFSVTPSGVERVLHSFGGGTDGSMPTGALLVYNGALYGVTEAGGSHGVGTVFAATPTGSERVVHSFAATAIDGNTPAAGLSAVNGVLYGTTIAGGTFDSNEQGGTVFSVTPSGVEHVVHNFGNGKDGQNPAAELLNVNGTLYGTTLGGGTYGALGGTVFSIRP